MCIGEPQDFTDLGQLAVKISEDSETKWCVELGEYWTGWNE